MSKNQLYAKDVEVGSEIPALAKVATSQMLVKWAGASGDFNPLHFEPANAKLNGIDEPIVHGQLKRAWLIQMITDWIGDEGTMKKFACQFRAMDFPVGMKNFYDPVDDKPTHICKGNVIGKKVVDGENLIDCEIWVENQKGEKTTLGTATVALPSE